MKRTDFPLLKSSFIRLSLYFFTVCSIPLLITVLLLYRSHDKDAEQEARYRVQQAHDYALLSISQSFAELDSAIDALSADYAVQRLVNRSGWDDSEDQEVRDYLDNLLRRQMNRFKAVTALCLTYDDPGLSICQQDRSVPAYAFEVPPFPLKRNERQLLVMKSDSPDGASAAVQYVTALYDRRTNVTKGSVSAQLRMNRLISQLQLDGLENFTLRSAEGTTVYRMKPYDTSVEQMQAEANGQEDIQVREDSVVSYRKLDLNGTVWYSSLELHASARHQAFPAFREAAAALAGILLLTVILNTVVLNRLLMKPLNRLKILMKRAEQGDLKAYWVGGGTSEMNELGEGYNQMLNRLEGLIKQVKVEEALKTEAEITALHYQLNPHFLYNTLNTIKWVAKLHQVPEISGAVTALVRLLQASLGKNGDFVEVREEVELLKAYMDIQRFRYGDKVELRLEIDPLSFHCLVPRMILQPLVENAILHGIAPSVHKGAILVKIWLERDLLFCMVEDNGVGYREPEQGANGQAAVLKERMSGIGLNHIREKIKLYYGQDYKLYVFGQERRGTTVRFTLPVHQSEG